MGLTLNATIRRAGSLLMTALLLCAISAQAQQRRLEALFYLTNAPDAIASFERNASQVSIIGPQSYRVDARGTLSGSVPDRVLEIARQHHIPVMPLIVNPGWNLELFHTLVNDSLARGRMIEQMVTLGKEHDFWGWQFDFEQIHISDRDALTRFYRDAARALHEQRMKISIAVYPDPGDLQNASPFHTWLWEYLIAAYDLKELAAAGDFISLMTYLQHTPRTPPGPVGGLPYMRRVVETALGLGIPADKLSLGVPFFSMHWYTDWNAEKKGFVWSRGMSWQAATDMLARAGAQLTWDGTQGASFAQWENHGVFEYAWLEDSRAFAPKLDLARKNGMRGISVWRIGQEDPRVWSYIPK